MLDFALWFVFAVAAYQALDIYQRRQIDGIDSYRAAQAAQIRIRYDSYLKHVDRFMAQLVATELELNNRVAQCESVGERIEEMVGQIADGVAEVNDQIRAAAFVRNGINRLPNDQS